MVDRIKDDKEHMTLNMTLAFSGTEQLGTTKRMVFMYLLTYYFL